MDKEYQAGPIVYQIRIAGHLDEGWSDWFEGLQIEPHLHGKTCITGPVADQAALHGILNRIFDLGLALISVRRIDDTPQDGPIPGERDSTIKTGGRDWAPAPTDG
jgi:hypothetical protein